MTVDEDVCQALQDGDLVRLRELLEGIGRGAARATGPDGMSVLMQAVYGRRPEAVRLLLEFGALASVHEAAALGDVDALTRFLAKGSKVRDTPGPDGFTPLHLAAHFAQHDAVEVLLEAGADLEATSANGLGNTALHAAAAGAAVSTVRVLLASGADANARDAGGNTPLHVAAAGGAIPSLQALLEGGADPAGTNARGETPGDMARARGQDEAVAILERATSRPV